MRRGSSGARRLSSSCSETRLKCGENVLPQLNENLVGADTLNQIADAGELVAVCRFNQMAMVHHLLLEKMKERRQDLIRVLTGI